MTSNEQKLIDVLNDVINAAEIIDGQSSPPDDEDVDYLHAVIAKARDVRNQVQRE